MCACVLTSSFKDTSQVGLEFTLVTSFDHNDPRKAQPPVEHQGVRTLNFGRQDSALRPHVVLALEMTGKANAPIALCARGPRVLGDFLVLLPPSGDMSLLWINFVHADPTSGGTRDLSQKVSFLSLLNSTRGRHCMPSDGAALHPTTQTLLPKSLPILGL
jgi:hypothetical protein